MPSDRPVGTTLKLDYWDERWRMGTLFPTTWCERRLAWWARLWRSALYNSSHNFFNNKNVIPWVCIFVQWLQDASKAATHQRWRFLTIVSLTVVATGMGFYGRCKERAWAQHRIIEFSWRCRAKICSLQQTPPTTQAGVQGVRKGLGKRIGILWWWWGHPTSLTIMSPAEMMYCHHCLCKFLVLRTRFAAKGSNVTGEQWAMCVTVKLLETTQGQRIMAVFRFTIGWEELKLK